MANGELSFETWDGGLLGDLHQLKLSHELKIFRQVQIQSEGWEVYDLEPCAGFLRALAMSLKRILAKIVFDQAGRGNEQGVCARSMPVWSDNNGGWFACTLN